MPRRQHLHQIHENMIIYSLATFRHGGWWVIWFISRIYRFSLEFEIYTSLCYFHLHMSTFHNVFPLTGTLGITPEWYDLGSPITGFLSRFCYNFFIVDRHPRGGGQTWSDACTPRSNLFPLLLFPVS